MDSSDDVLVCEVLTAAESAEEAEPIVSDTTRSAEAVWESRAARSDSI